MEANPTCFSLQRNTSGSHSQCLAKITRLVQCCYRCRADVCILPFGNSKFCSHIVFMCFLCISEQTAIISLFNINWLVFITETECVYCAVRTGYLKIFMCFVWISEQTAITRISLYSIDWLVFITETECVYSAVRTGYLNIIQVNFICEGVTECSNLSLHSPLSPLLQRQQKCISPSQRSSEF